MGFSTPSHPVAYDSILNVPWNPAFQSIVLEFTKLPGDATLPTPGSTFEIAYLIEA